MVRIPLMLFYIGGTDATEVEFEIIFRFRLDNDETIVIVVTNSNLRF